MTTAKPLARYSAVEGALASGFATAELHHLSGHDPNNLIGIAAGKQPVQEYFLDSHVMILSFPSSWPRAQNS